MSLPACWSKPLPAPDAHYAQQALARQNVLTKPRGSLGRLEQVAIQLAGLQATDHPGVDPARISVFAGDHGVCREGVSAYPQAVTAQMIANFAQGGAAISVLARQLGAFLEVVNLGTVGEVPDRPGIRQEPIAACTANLMTENALSEAQLETALTSGDQAAARASEAGCRLFIGGEMGIGNTTSATAMACALLDQDPGVLTGPGTGLDEKGVEHKRAVIRQALARHGSKRGPLHDPLQVLTSLGGFEIAGLVGAILGCASRRIPVLVDGFIVSVAALVAVRQQPTLRDWLIFAHQSAEPGHQTVLAAMDATPLLQLGMRLGEGSGAAVALPLLQSACALHNGMASFADAGVSEKTSE
jgi:nicotinate-nucleotide--dimethylbenzimidazole phosphoribosyltransferase